MLMLYQLILANILFRVYLLYLQCKVRLFIQYSSTDCFSTHYCVARQPVQLVEFIHLKLRSVQSKMEPVKLGFSMQICIVYLGHFF